MKLGATYVHAYLPIYLLTLRTCTSVRILQPDLVVFACVALFSSRVLTAPRRCCSLHALNLVRKNLRRRNYRRLGWPLSD